MASGWDPYEAGDPTRCSGSMIEEDGYQSNLVDLTMPIRRPSPLGFPFSSLPARTAYLRLLPSYAFPP